MQYSHLHLTSLPTLAPSISSWKTECEREERSFWAVWAVERLLLARAIRPRTYQEEGSQLWVDCPLTQASNNVLKLCCSTAWKLPVVPDPRWRPFRRWGWWWSPRCWTTSWSRAPASCWLFQCRGGRAVSRCKSQQSSPWRWTEEAKHGRNVTLCSLASEYFIPATFLNCI